MDKQLSRRLWTAVAYPPLSDMAQDQRREFQDALLAAKTFEDLPGKWQAALLESEANAPDLKSSMATDS